MYAWESGPALVQTVDFFTPIVDDPYVYGQIAAANALSDVYAMGGRPLTALAIAGFPKKGLDEGVIGDIFRGGFDKLREAGVALLGGHTVQDDELKFGYAVTGAVDPGRILTNSGARPGDTLILTKPIGTGILSTAGKRGALAPEHGEALYESMRTLNRDASRAALAVGARCATDVTGFGLLGHARHIAKASGVRLVIDHAAVPLLPGTAEALAAGHVTGGAKRNARWLDDDTDWNDTGDAVRALLSDPQTSGGLLVALEASRVEEFIARQPRAVVVGRVDAYALGPCLQVA